MADDDNSSEIISQKVPTIRNNYELCILCQENHPNLEVRRNPELDTFATLLQYLKERQSFGDSKVLSNLR